MTTARPIAISLSPNTTASDVRLARQLLLRPATWRDDSPVQQATAAFQQLFPGYTALLLSSGRAALYRLLTALAIGPDDEVIVQAFTCSAVPAAVQWTGARPVFADINPATFNLDPASVARRITSHTRAIILQHTFGLPADIPALTALAKQHNLSLLEDCAHALGSQYQNRPLGTFGQAAIVSFGRDKIISSVFGGAIITQDQTLLTRLRAQISPLAPAPRLWIMQQLHHLMLLDALLPVYFRLELGKLGLVAAQRLHLLSRVLTMAEKQGRMPPHLNYRFPGALAELLLSQLKQLPTGIARRRAVGNRYQSALSGHTNLTLPAVSPPSQVAWLRYPLLVAHPTQLRRQARAQSMLLGDWYDTPIAPRDIVPRTFGYNPGTCPVAEDIARRVINLPTYPRLTDQQVEQVIRFIKINV